MAQVISTPPNVKRADSPKDSSTPTLTKRTLKLFTDSEFVSLYKKINKYPEVLSLYNKKNLLLTFLMFLATILLVVTIWEFPQYAWKVLLTTYGSAPILIFLRTLVWILLTELMLLMSFVLAYKLLISEHIYRFFSIVCPPNFPGGPR